MKIKNIFPIYTFFLDQYDESSLERFQSLEFMSQSFFFFETTKKNFAFLKIFEFIRNIISFFLSNFPTERFLFQYFNEYLRPFLIFLAKIFRKPRFNQRTKVYENFLLRNQIILPSFYDKNFWYELLMKIISPKKQILKIFPSFKHGWGIFCQKKNIPSMTILTEYRGESQKILNLNQIEIFYRFLRKDLFLFKLNEQKTIDATYKGNMGRLINHSCNPNCFSKIINHAGKNHILIITHMNLKNIDEIDYDYRINSDDHDFEQILCNCDTFFCRRKLSL